MNHKAFNISFNAVDRDFETLRETSFRKKSILWKIKYKTEKTHIPSDITCNWIKSYPKLTLSSNVLDT